MAESSSPAAAIVDLHPDATELVELACGDLDREVAVSLQHHCQVCDDCARQLRALVGLRDLCGLAVPGEARGALSSLGPPTAVRVH